jgi:hypothetical protein
MQADAWPTHVDSRLAPQCDEHAGPLQESLAHQLLAAADFVLVPSRFEPCGLVAQASDFDPRDVKHALVMG